MIDRIIPDVIFLFFSRQLHQLWLITLPHPVLPLFPLYCVAVIVLFFCPAVVHKCNLTSSFTCFYIIFTGTAALLPDSPLCPSIYSLLAFLLTLFTHPETFLVFCFSHFRVLFFYLFKALFTSVYSVVLLDPSPWKKTQQCCIRAGSFIFFRKCVFLP